MQKAKTPTTSNLQAVVDAKGKEAAVNAKGEESHPINKEQSMQKAKKQLSMQKAKTPTTSNLQAAVDAKGKYSNNIQSSSSSQCKR